jgi:hypothetical protein
MSTFLDLLNRAENLDGENGRSGLISTYHFRNAKHKEPVPGGNRLSIAARYYFPED